MGYRSSQAQLENIKLGAEARKIYDEPKIAKISASVTPTSKQGIVAIASEYGVNVSELLERLGRGEFELVRKAS